MLRIALSAALGLLLSISYGQLKKFYSLRSCAGYDTVDFSLEAPSGSCLVQKAVEDIGPLHIYGNPDLEKVNPSFRANISDNTCKVNLGLEEFRSKSISDGILFAMMGGPAMEENYWKILFDQEKVYKLDLNYGFGKANVDLDGTAVKSLKINSGSADVLIDYKNREVNSIVMDTFMVRVDMGSLVAKNVDCANAGSVIADVGFGMAVLDFSEGSRNKCRVNASVGAGNLDIILPKSGVPTIIHIKDSPLCGVKLVPGFEQVEKNVFINMNYTADAPNLLSFDLDVAMGNVAFHYED